MKSRVDLQLVEEAATFALRFRCDDCVYFDDDKSDCVHGYPVAPHRPSALAPGDELVFCKEFDLGGGAP